MGRQLPEKEKQYLLSIKPDEIVFSLLVDLFGDKVKVVNRKVQHIPSRIRTDDEFYLEKGEYFNTERIKTNAGLFVYNKLIIERNFKDVVGYVNKPVDKKVLNDIESKLSKALLNAKITVDQMVKYLNDTQWLAKQFHSVVSGSFTMNTLKPLPKIVKERDRLLKENRAKIDQGDVITAVNIEKKLLKDAEEALKGDHGLDLYQSGARGSFGNNFKNIAVMKGPVFNPTTGQFDIIESNFMEGIRKEEIPIYGDAIITGAYPKAIGTAVSGYFSKQIIAALQAVVLAQRGSDCGSKATLQIIIRPEKIDDFLYRYIVDRGKLVLLDDEVIKKYLNKPVQLRTPEYCITDKKCRICAGLMYEKLEIENIGLTAARVSSTLLGLSMKKFHDSTAKIYTVKIDEMII